MPWPGITDFSEAVQNPRLCFKSTELEAGKVSLNQRGMPLVFSGAFACVYPVSVGNRTFAVRCFTREVSDQQSRYGELSNYLLNVLPPSFVHFEYQEHGISLRGDWYPIVRMEWVDGELLSRFVGSRLDQPDTLRRIAAQWRGGPTASLRGLRIAHNDLQHGNVMVQRDGSVRLVDYDGMFLPQFRGRRSSELGHKNYQHPQRSPEHYDDYVDNFPSLVIYLSLLAIASDPGLWAFYNDDNLIFTRKDYADPAASELFTRLKKSPDRTVAKLTERLEECCALPLEKVPDLEAILQDIPPTAVSPPAAVPSATAGNSYRQTLQALQPTPAPPTPAATTQRPITPRAARPAPPARPIAAPPTPPTKFGRAKRCLTCGRTNSATATVCANCGAALAASTVRPYVAGPRSNLATPAISTKGVLERLEEAAGIGVAALKSSAASGELKTVVLGVVATVVTVTAFLVAGVAWVVSQRGW